MSRVRRTDPIIVVLGSFVIVRWFASYLDDTQWSENGEWMLGFTAKPSRAVVTWPFQAVLENSHKEKEERMDGEEEEEVVAEVEAMKAVYGSDCVLLRSPPPHFHISLKPRTADVSSEQATSSGEEECKSLEDEKLFAEASTIIEK